MPTPIWPPSLPPPLLRGFGETLPAVAIRTSMDAGPAKARRRASTGPTPVTIELLLTRAQVATLEAFHNDTTLGGTLEWDWKNHRTQDATQTWRYRFTSEPSLTPLAPSTSDSKMWRAQFNAELRLIPEEPPPDPTGDDDSPPMMLAPPSIEPELEVIAGGFIEPPVDDTAGWPDPPAVIPMLGLPTANSADNEPMPQGELVGAGAFIESPAGPTLGGLGSPASTAPISTGGFGSIT